MSEVKEPRKIWIAKSSIRDFADPTEPNLYPDKFAELIERSAYDALKAENERMRVALEFYANRDNYDTHSAWGKVCILNKDTELVSVAGMQFRCGGKTAREALSGKVE